MEFLFTFMDYFIVNELSNAQSTEKICKHLHKQLRLTAQPHLNSYTANHICDNPI